MHVKYNCNLFLTLIAVILFVINCVTADSLKKVTKMTSADSQEETSKQEVADVLSIGQYFQDIFSEHLAPFKIEFGHVCENPSEWEQRFERKDFDDNRHSGKIKWGNKNGEYGEHYWDLNH